MHERKVEGSDEPLELRVSGAVLHGNLIMFDKESNTRWLQETGNAIDGQQKGKSLKELDDKNWEANVRWDVWIKKHPESELLFSPIVSSKTNNKLAKASKSDTTDMSDQQSQEEAVESEDSTSE